MSAREIIAKAVSDDLTGGWVEEYGETADAVIAALAATRYRILAPGELDQVTLEKAAEVADAYISVAANNGLTHFLVANEIRALNTGGE